MSAGIKPLFRPLTSAAFLGEPIPTESDFGAGLFFCGEGEFSGSILGVLDTGSLTGRVTKGPAIGPSGAACVIPKACDAIGMPRLARRAAPDQVFARALDCIWMKENGGLRIGWHKAYSLGLQLAD